MELASCNCITKQIWNTEDTLLSDWVVPEKIHPPMEQITITPSLYPTILYKLKTFFSESPSTLSGQQKFPLWVGYGFLFGTTHFAHNTDFNPSKNSKLIICKCMQGSFTWCDNGLTCIASKFSFFSNNLPVLSDL